MNRWIATCVAAALTSAAVVGCKSNAYQPDADNAKLASYAAQTKYPADLTAVPADSIFYSVGDNGVITLNNAGDQSLASFNLWVNKSFVLMVPQLPAHSQATYAPELFFNRDGTSLKAQPVDPNWAVEIQGGGRLMTAKGPVKM